jgi:Cu+-exporting ATPase
MLRMMEATPEMKATMAIDPVCGMTVDPATATDTATHDGTTYFFCSAGCRQEFETHAEQYVAAASAAAHQH